MAEKVIKKSDHYEVEPWRMTGYIHQQVMNDAAIQKIMQDKMMYLTWMHKLEAGRCLPGYTKEELES